MARDLNNVIVIGRLVRDPEIKYTQTGTPVTKFSIANNQSYVQNNERKDYVNYFDINVWGNQAINCEKYLKKGSQVAINGALRQNRWEDKTTGQVKSKIEITANNVHFLSTTSQPQSGSSNFSNQNKNDFQGLSSNNPNGMIQDPWNDTDMNLDDSNSFSDSMNNDDDIPF